MLLSTHPDPGVPLYSDSGVLGADATSDTSQTIVDIPNGYMVHLLTLIESLFQSNPVTLAYIRVSSYNLSSDSL